MKCITLISFTFGFSIGLSCGLLLCLPNNFLNKTTPVEDINCTDKIEVVKDTLQYQSIDTMIVTYPWGREEIYYFKYKDS
jgi:hypothetical protein